MKNSNFVNITGLDAVNHYSTAEDIRILLEYALNNPLFKEIYTTKSYTLMNGLVVKATVLMYEKKLNIDTSRIIGSKTGTTENAGLCLSSLFRFQDHEMLIVTIHAPYDNNYYNILDNLNLIQFIDDNYQIKEPEIDIEEKIEVVTDVPEGVEYKLETGKPKADKGLS